MGILSKRRTAVAITVAAFSALGASSASAATYSQWHLKYPSDADPSLTPSQNCVRAYIGIYGTDFVTGASYQSGYASYDPIRMDCLVTMVYMLPFQADQDFSDGVIDFQPLLEFYWRPGLQPIPEWPKPKPSFKPGYTWVPSLMAIKGSPSYRVGFALAKKK